MSEQGWMRRFWGAACQPLVDELWSMRHPVTWARRTARNLRVELLDAALRRQYRREYPR